MPQGVSRTGFLNRAAAVSYLMSLELLLFVPVTVLLIYSTSFASASGSGIIQPALPLPNSFGSSNLSVTIFVSLVGLPFFILFGYFNIEVGKYYGVPALRRAGQAGILLSALLFAFWPVVYTLSTISSSSVSGNSGPGGPLRPFVAITAPPMLYITLLILWIALFFVVALVYVVNLYNGMEEMSKNTGIQSFSAAKKMWLIGLITYVTLPIATILYGNALRELRGLEQTTASLREARPRPGANANYCPHCGSKIELGEHFCARCGSPIYEEG